MVNKFEYRVIFCSPWHGACFNVKTGDIEEAPGASNLNKYKIEIEDDKVFILAEEDRLISLFSPVYSQDCNVCSDETAVIVGGGAAGAIAAESLRVNGFAGRIVMVSKEPHLPIDRIKLSKSIDADANKLALFSLDYFENKLKI
jgi:apoptosis-inducing factor 3